MTIKFACEDCGKSLGVDEQYAGRRIKCPKCEHVMRVPEIEVEPEVDEGFADLNDLAALEAAGDSQDLNSVSTSELSTPSSSVNRCPKCNATINPGAIICIQCGHNLAVGKNVKTIERNEKIATGAKKTSRIGIGIVASLVVAMIGAGIWAGIGILSGYEIGWVAWGIGALAGIGATAASNENSFRVGVAAALIALLAIVSGKLMIAEWALGGGELEEFTEVIVKNWPAEMIQNEELMFEVGYYELEVAGKIDQDVLDWNDSQSEVPVDASGEPDPVIAGKIIATHQQIQNLIDRWTRKEKTDACKRYLKANAHLYLDAVDESMSFQDKLTNTLSLWDLLWFGLAVTTAFKIGNGSGS